MVTHKRHQILTTQTGRECLRNAIKEVQEHHPFELTAIVLLPDHLHTIWEAKRNGMVTSSRTLIKWCVSTHPTLLNKLYALS
ncbi:MAG: transposase [Planctomycetaceae bacterium]|nr:transposase [Planctomycetaceae bacterium]